MMVMKLMISLEIYLKMNLKENDNIKYSKIENNINNIKKNKFW